MKRIVKKIKKNKERKNKCISANYWVIPISVLLWASTLTPEGSKETREIKGYPHKKNVINPIS